MKIVWDEPKRLTNLRDHPGHDFADLTVEFFETAFVVPVKLSRLMAINEFRGETIVAVIFAPLGSEAVSVISMRRASPKERRAYERQR